MSDALPIAEQAQPIAERGEPPAHPLGADFMALTSQMAAIMLQNLIASSAAEISTQQAAEIAVELAMKIANEVREYRIVENRVVKLKPPEDTNG